MSGFDDKNTGTLQRNKDKDGSEERKKWADFKGRINIDGRWHYLDGWERNGRYGRFLSLKLGPQFVPRGDGNRGDRMTSTPAPGSAPDTVTCVGPNGERLTVSRELATKLSLQILDTEPRQDFDDDVPF